MVTGNANIFLLNCQQIFMSVSQHKRETDDFACRRISAPAWGDFIVATFLALSSGCSNAPRASPYAICPESTSSSLGRMTTMRRLRHPRDPERTAEAGP
jgi:hypothetical protein